MRTIYIGSGQNKKSNHGRSFKVTMYLFLFLAVLGSALKVTGPIIVEEWINRNGAGKNGIAFSVRDVDFSLMKGQLILNDVKVFNPKTSGELLESPRLTIQLNLKDLVLYQDKNYLITADQVDAFLSKDISVLKQELGVDLNTLESKIGKLNVIEKKEDQSRTMLELNEVNFVAKTNSEFNFLSKVAEGGSLELTGKAGKIQGSLKHVRSNIFNKLAGDKLPFTFNESFLDAQINAHVAQGKISGEISPEIRKLNLLEESPGNETRSIARILNEELTFTLPFTLKEELVLQYEDTYKKLKSYRKYAASDVRPQSVQAQSSPVSHTEKDKKSFSFWPF